MTDNVGSNVRNGAVKRPSTCANDSFSADPKTDSRTDSQTHSRTDSEDHVADIYEQYASHIAAYAIRRTTHTDAADVVAETFLVAWRRREVVPQEPNTLPWLCGVARRVLANQRRSHRRRGRLSERLTAEFARHEVCTPAHESAEEFRRVARAIDKLSEDDAELLRLLAWEALTPSEVAVAMDIAPGTARQRISRARQRLQKELAADGDDADFGEQQAVSPIKPHTPVRHGSQQATVLYPSTGGGGSSDRRTG